MKIELPSSETVYKTGQCIPVKISFLPKTSGGVVVFSIYPVFYFPIGTFPVNDEGEVNVPCLIVFPYNYSFLKGMSFPTEFTLEVNGAGSLFLQTAGTKSFKFEQVLPKKYYILAQSKSGKYSITVYGFNKDYQLVTKSKHIVEPGADQYIPILLGDWFEIDGGISVGVAYKGNDSYPSFIKYSDVSGLDFHGSSMSYNDLSLKLVSHETVDHYDYFVVKFINPYGCQVNVLYVDYYTGWTVAQISPHGFYHAYVNAKYPWYNYQGCGNIWGYGVVKASGEVRL